jgi:hypothetical protein
MRKFGLTSAKFIGEVTMIFDTDGFLQEFKMTGELSAAQKRFILNNFPCFIDDMERFQKIPSLNVIEVEFKVSFDMFWDKYNDKERSSKKKSLIKWDKMNPTDQAKAYLFIDKYNRNRGTAEKKYAETYLNAELWNN